MIGQSSSDLNGRPLSYAGDASNNQQPRQACAIQAPMALIMCL